MNGHLELSQQMEKERVFDSASSAASVIQIERGRSKLTNHIQSVDDEALWLVQKVFLVPTPPKVVVFAGVEHGNGCSRVSASVAEALARNARRPVCLVEANFRSPGLLELMQAANHHGFTEALVEKGPISSFAKPVGQDNLWLLSSGAVSSDSPSLLTSERLQDRIIELRETFDFVVIDAPPLNQYSDAIALGQLSDGLVLVLEAESTRRETASAVASNLRSMNVPILAAVLNKRSFPIPKALYSRL